MPVTVTSGVGYPDKRDGYDVTAIADGKIGFADHVSRIMRIIATFEDLMGYTSTGTIFDRIENLEELIIETVTDLNTPFTLNNGSVALGNSTNAISLVLPTALTSLGRVVKIKNINTGLFTVSVFGGGLIEGEVNIQLAEKEFVTLISDGSAWWVI